MTIRLGRDVAQQLHADDFAVWPGQLRFHRQVNPDIQELITSFDLSEVTGVTIVGSWQGRVRLPYPPQSPSSSSSRQASGLA